MIDLAVIDQDTIVARGQYATVRSAHEDEKKRLAILCSQWQGISSQILRQLQPDSDVVPEPVDSLLAQGRRIMDGIEACSNEIASLAMQRAELKARAWNR